MGGGAYRGSERLKGRGLGFGVWGIGLYGLRGSQAGLAHRVLDHMSASGFRDVQF